MRNMQPRAWDKQYEQMVKVTMILFDTNEIDHSGNNGEPKSIDHFELMYPTGEEDKNNKMIYEGDKVKYETGNPGNSFIVEEVIFKGGAYYPICTQPGKTFEVVGHKYENPGLI